MKIAKIHLEHLRNEAHYQFLLLVQGLLARFPGIAGLVGPQIPEFNRLLTLEGQLVDAVKASEYTQEIAETDRRVDRDIVGITAAVESALHHFNPAIVEAAHKVDIHLKSFHGSIEKKTYEEEAAAVKILLIELKTTCAPQIAILGLNDWVTELTAAQAEFERLYNLRNDERTGRTQGNLREIRKEIDTVYRTMIQRIEAYSVLNGDEGVKDFILKLNGDVEYFNEHTHHHGKKDIDKATVTSIDNQVYNGEPVVVLPEVFDNGEKLVFTKDYELSYRNNTRPGTASVSIRGKGLYKGAKVVSFNIIEN